MGLNFAVALHEAALRHPQRNAVVLDSVEIDYRTLDHMCDRLAAGLMRLGVGAGDRILLVLPNVPHFVIAYFGILRLGAVAVPVNVLLKANELAYHLEDSGAGVVIVWEDFADEVLGAVAQCGRELSVFVASRPGSQPRSDATKTFDSLLEADPPGAFPGAQSEPGDTAVILYTSGTTGRPKGAALSHSNLFMNAWIGTQIIRAQEDDVIIGVLPLFHSFGQSAVMNTSVLAGSTLTLVPRFDSGAVLQVMARDHVTIFAGVPTMYFGLLHHPGEIPDVSSLRLCVSGGAAMPAEVMRAFEERYNVVVLEGYGLSETSPVATFNRSPEERRTLSIGKPVWGVEVQIWDDSLHRLELGPEHVGEIVIRGHNVMSGYWRQPEATQEALAGGWFHSGDLGYEDADGFLYIVDRKKDMILRGGFNVYPREVEEVLFQHPVVAAAAVIGVADTRLGEEVKAVVQLKPGQTANAVELIDFCRQRLAAYKYPRSVEFVDSMPVGGTGKILKRELRARFELSGEATEQVESAGRLDQKSS
ncbi:MAG TPA: long-chain fatty acid--CoA ligase [Candidatus Nitrosotalea sp.]|nr:long-chain fatty acid--CoA ligase [Candidatus Nitrosotalea sp.]